MYEESSLDEGDARYVETYFVNYYLKKKKEKSSAPVLLNLKSNRKENMSVFF